MQQCLLAVRSVWNGGCKNGQTRTIKKKWGKECFSRFCPYPHLLSMVILKSHLRLPPHNSDAPALWAQEVSILIAPWKREKVKEILSCLWSWCQRGWVTQEEHELDLLGMSWRFYGASREQLLQKPDTLINGEIYFLRHLALLLLRQKIRLNCTQYAAITRKTKCLTQR